MITNLAVKEDEGIPEFHNCAFDDRLICHAWQCEGCQIASRDLPVLSSIVMGHIFTYDGQALLFERADCVSIGAITGGCKFAENYVVALAREIKEKTGLDVKKHQMIKVDRDFVTFTPTTSGKRIKIAPFGIFMPKNFNPAREIKLNGELSGYKVVELEVAEKILNRRALPETREVFRILTGF